MTTPLPVICLMAPTASGKTDLAVELVQKFPKLKIISVDSALVYKGLNIGAAKPNAEILAMAPHRLIDILEPTEIYTAGNFCQDAIQEIEKIHAENNIPLLVGGTMLYFWTLQHGLAPLPTADVAIRQQITEQALAEGWPELHKQLANVDWIAASKIQPTDGQRIQRALEVYRLTGIPMSQWQQQATVAPAYLFKNVIWAPPRDWLHARIKQRTQLLFDRGFIEEVQNLCQQAGMHPDLPSMRTVGYRQIAAYLKNPYQFSKLQETVFYATCQLAKRQATWLKRWKDAKGLKVDIDADKKINKFICNELPNID
ncbi:MAG: tRNA (adenosine(37)-N6)-dimethylallyltransferase MiaA [Proteobacteria bacterium]|nr:tRNA (adenosine(37)-N6)-dimethylallyltransferase MiaA [Pseudomonadota bacterium]